jgi:indolepyruvate ferredoxin oxidoreductase beta subunit
MKSLNIIISGVGGQGNILLERIIGKCAIAAGWKATAADTFGAAQRGGSVVSQIRLGDKVKSSLIPQGKCDVIIGLEPGEALRTAGRYVAGNTLVIVNTSPILPAKVKTGECAYPPVKDILLLIENAAGRVIHFDATGLAKKATGDIRYTNIVMAGAFASQKLLPVDLETYKTIITETTGVFAKKNLMAFDAGLKQGSA